MSTDTLGFNYKNKNTDFFPIKSFYFSLFYLLSITFSQWGCDQMKNRKNYYVKGTVLKKINVSFIIIFGLSKYKLILGTFFFTSLLFLWREV